MELGDRHTGGRARDLEIQGGSEQLDGATKRDPVDAGQRNRKVFAEGEGSGRLGETI